MHACMHTNPGEFGHEITLKAFSRLMKSRASMNVLRKPHENEIMKYSFMLLECHCPAVLRLSLNSSVCSFIDLSYPMKIFFMGYGVFILLSTWIVRDCQFHWVVSMITLLFIGCENVFKAKSPSSVNAWQHGCRCFT